MLPRINRSADLWCPTVEVRHDRFRSEADAPIRVCWGSRFSAAGQNSLCRRRTSHNRAPGPGLRLLFGWVQHLQQAGFRTNVLETRDIDTVKRKLGVTFETPVMQRIEASASMAHCTRPCAALPHADALLTALPWACSPESASSLRLRWPAPRWRAPPLRSRARSRLCRSLAF
jgi:hypothetical protein